MGKKFSATYTQWSMYHTCPHQYYRVYQAEGDEKVGRQSSEALEKGIRVHDGLEKFLKGEADKLPEEVHDSWLPYYTALKEDAPEVEAFLRNDVAYGKLDVYKKGEYVQDHKSGKARINDPGIREQLRFYVFLAKEDLEASLLWVEHEFKKSKLTIKLKYTDILNTVWRKRIEKMQTDTTHEKTKSWKCNYCPVEPCEFYKNWK